MGGFGSGRRGGYGRIKVEACLSLDVNHLQQQGCLRAGRSSNCTWTRGNEQIGALAMHAELDRLNLSYRTQVDGNWEDVTEAIGIVHVPCHLGGTRPYFVCPGVVKGVACRRRVGMLYAAARYFLCRHCYRLAHASQSENAWDRALRRASKTRQRLGGEPGMAASFPPKPKGMWRRTYDRLREQVFQTEMDAEDAFLASSSQFLARVERYERDRKRGRSGKRSFWR